MSSQGRIQKRGSLDSLRRLLVTNPLKTRGFSNGVQARESRLPETNILQTRPFAPRVQKSHHCKKILNPARNIQEFMRQSTVQISIVPIGSTARTVFP